MFGDIGIGIILTIILTTWFNIDLKAVHILWGIVFSLLPDIDMLIFVFPSFKKIFKKHRGLSHYPIIYFFISVLIWSTVGSFWALLFGLSSLIHFIHDTLWIGTGITWYWPFSTKSYTFFSQDHKAPRDTHWIAAFYFRPTIVSITEFSVFILALLFLLLTILNTIV